MSSLVPPVVLSREDKMNEKLPQALPGRGRGGVQETVPSPAKPLKIENRFILW